MHYLHFPFALPCSTKQSKKRALRDGYFACCFDCCKTWTCQCRTDLLVLVQYILGHRICSRFSAVWNLLKSSDLSTVDLRSDYHIYSVWKKLYSRFQRWYYMCTLFLWVFAGGFFFFVSIIIAKLLLMSSKLSRSISSQVYCYRLLQQTD